jgi:peptidoglycan/LPS O-acetylase OafA/YrhL
MPRVPELDAVRGLASLMILVYHFYARRLPFGWAAVDLFFVLSGYLITTIILVNRDSPRFLLHFYIRRGLRIWPIYYLSLLLLLVIGPFLPRPSRLAGLPYYLTYTQYVEHYWSATATEFSWYFKHTWTLAIEEQFYLLWPAAVLLVGRRRVVPLALALLATSVAARYRGVHWWILLARADGFALGGLLAALKLAPPRIGMSRGLPRAGLLALGTAALAYLVAAGALGGLPDHGAPPRPAATILAINLFCFALIGLVVAHSGHPALRLLRARRLAGLGTISYGLYLYHMIILRIRMDVMRQAGLRSNAWIDALTLAACFAAAVLSWRFVERPILALKDRFPYREAGSPRPRPAGRTLVMEPGHAFVATAPHGVQRDASTLA